MGFKVNYIQDPAEIYRRSFAIVEDEAQLEGLPEAMRSVATRLIHACGMVDIVEDLAFSDSAAEAGQFALLGGAPIYCDVEMVRSGIIANRLPAGNLLRCSLSDPRTPAHAQDIGNTRCAAATDFWSELEGAVVVIGNAPTALFRLMERVASEGTRPALVVATPVGFVGAVESKQALASFKPEIPFITVHGRRGGSAMACAIVNALAGGPA